MSEEEEKEMVERLVTATERIATSLHYLTMHFLGDLEDPDSEEWESSAREYSPSASQEKQE